MKVVKYPNSILTTPTKDIAPSEVESPEIQALIKEMVELCLDLNALGLAANQVGVNKSLIVYRRPGTDSFGVLINPVITARADRITNRGEGCLSFPGKFFDVKRFKQVKVEALDRNGELRIIKTKSKKTAKVLQHEIDHLNGITLADRGRKL